MPINVLQDQYLYTVKIIDPEFKGGFTQQQLTTNAKFSSIQELEAEIST